MLIENIPDTPTYPDFEITLVHFEDGCRFVRATIEGRLCNVHYAAAAYIAGDRPPHYPVPALPTKLQPLKHGIALIERPGPNHSGWHFVVVADDEQAYEYHPAASEYMKAVATCLK